MNTPAPRDDLATSQSHSPEEAARARLRGLGSRVTEPRVRVLAVLMQGADPLSHQAVCDALPDDSGIDRVAAGAQNLDRGQRRERVRGRHRPVAGIDGRAPGPAEISHDATTPE